MRVDWQLEQLRQLHVPLSLVFDWISSLNCYSFRRGRGVIHFSLPIPLPSPPRPAISFLDFSMCLKYLDSSENSRWY